jgi:hypothetical protein
MLTPRRVDRWLAMILLHDLCEGAINAEGPFDRIGIGGETIRRYLWPIEDAPPKIGEESVRVLAVALADQVGNDRLPGRVNSDENVLIAEVGRICRPHLPLLLADKTPKLVEFKPVHLDEAHHLIMQLGAAFANADAEAHDCITMNAGQPFGCADRATFRQGGNDSDLFIAR